MQGLDPDPQDPLGTHTTESQDSLSLEQQH